VNTDEIVCPEAFRPDDPTIQIDPYPYYSVLRDQKPVLASTFGEQPCWIVSRRKDVAQILMDPATFSSNTTPIPSMLHTDPPDHRRLRRMVAAMFTRKAVAPYGPRISQIAEELLDAAMERGRCDIVDDFAGPLTVATIALLLGIPVEDVERLRQLTRRSQDYVLAIRLGKEPTVEARSANQALLTFMSELARAETYTNGGVVSILAEQLAQAELNEEEYANFAVLLFVAGHTTTTNLIGNAIYMLADRPADLQRMRADESFIRPFLDEVLRTRPSFHRIMRVTNREVVVAGETIPQGAVVRLLLGSANRDPEFFDNPEMFRSRQATRIALRFRARDSHLLRQLAVATRGVTSAHRVGPAYHHSCVGCGKPASPIVRRYIQRIRIRPPPSATGLASVACPDASQVSRIRFRGGAGRAVK